MVGLTVVGRCRWLSSVCGRCLVWLGLMMRLRWRRFGRVGVTLLGHLRVVRRQLFLLVLAVGYLCILCAMLSMMMYFWLMMRLRRGSGIFRGVLGRWSRLSAAPERPLTVGVTELL